MIFDVALRLSKQFTKKRYVVLLIAACLLNFYVVSIVMQHLPPSVVFAVWGGMGLFGTILLSVVGFGDRLNLMQVGCIVVIIVATIALNLAT